MRHSSGAFAGSRLSALQFHGAQLGNDSLCLLAGRLLTLLGVDRFEHFRHNFDLGSGHNRENIAVEMHRATLVFGIREHLAHGLQHPHALVADDELYAICASYCTLSFLIPYRSSTSAVLLA